MSSEKRDDEGKWDTMTMRGLHNLFLWRDQVVLDQENSVIFRWYRISILGALMRENLINGPLAKRVRLTKEGGLEGFEILEKTPDQERNKLFAQLDDKTELPENIAEAIFEWRKLIGNLPQIARPTAVPDLRLVE